MTKSILDNFDLSQIAEPAGAPADVIRQVATERGINPDHLIGLAKLETRLGDASIKGDGNDTRNLFNIKDFSKSGTGTRALDKAEGSNDRYRQYGSYRESVEDLVGLLERRYPGALKAQDGQQFATALKRGGYATDPNYVQKLAGVIGGAAGGDATVAGWAAGLTDEDLRAAGGFGNSSVMDRASPSAAKPESGVLDGIKDSAIALEVGLLGGAKSLSDVFGADNAVSKNFDGAAKWVDSFTSPGRQQERQVRQAQIKDAEENGTVFDEIVANAGAFADAPLDITIGAIGSSAPTLLSLLIPGANATVAGRLIASGITGLAQGVGVAKGSIFEAVEKKLVDSGVDADTAKKTAAGAQAYAGENQGMIAANGALGFVAAITGADKSIAKFVSKKAAGKVAEEVAEKSADGVLKSVGKGVLKESPIEASQGGLERVTSNVALQNEGIDVPTFQGAAGQATLEGLASSGLGAAGGLMDRSAPVVNPLVKQLDDQIAKGNSPLSRATVAATPELKVDPITQRVGEVEAAFRADGLLDKLGAMGQGALTRQEFLEALSIARNPSQPAAYRARALESVEQAMTWLAEGRMPNVPGTGAPFSTALTTTEQPGTDLAMQAGGALTNPGAPEFFDANTVDGEVVRTDNMLDGPRALPAPPGQPLATQNQPADAGFFTPGDAASVADPVAEEKPQNQLQGQQESLQVATDSVANAVPVARTQVTAPKAVALPESGDNPGTAQTRKRKVQLEAMAATGFGAVERRPDGFFLVNEAAQEEMRLDGPGDAQLARAAIARSTPVVGSAINQTWTAFHPESGTLNIPRAEMPQIKSEHRGAMVNFLAARGIKGTQRIEPATDLKPTQAEFSQSKVDQAKAFQGNDRPVLVSSDGHVLDGHHQWLAKMQQQAPVKVMRLSAPIAQLLAVMQEFPSAGMTKAPTTLNPLTGDQDAERGDGRGGAGTAGDADSAAAPVAGAGDQAGAGRSGSIPTGGLRDNANQDARARGRALRDTPKDAAAALAISEQEGRPIALADPANPLTQAVDALLDTMAGLTGHRGIAIHDTSPSAFDGAAYRGRTFINVANPQMHVGQTIAHEFKHLTEKQPALKALYDRLWDLIPTEARRDYFENYLRSERRDAQGNVTRAQGDFAKISARDLQLLKDEMLADFMGQRFNDKAWLQQLAKQKPALFGNFVREWLAVLDNLIDALKGLMNRDGSRGIQDKDLDAQLGRYVAELQQMKALATEVAIAWAEKNPGLAESTGAGEAVYSARKDDLDLDNLFNDEVDADLMAELNDELNGEQGQVSDAKIKAQGLMAEDAFAAIEWEEMGDGQRQALADDGRGRLDRMEMLQEPDGELWSLGIAGTWVGPNVNEPEGWATQGGVEDFARRQVAGRQLMARGFDLASTVSSAARARLAEAWKVLSRIGAGQDSTGARRYAEVGDDAKKLTEMARDMGVTVGYDVAVRRLQNDDGSTSQEVSFTNKKTGEIYAATLDVASQGGQKHLTTNTMELGRSGLGAAWYQMAAEYAARQGLQLRPEASLSGVNSYRRTEQMLSAALRTGKTDVMTPHAVQRVYGFETGELTPAQHDANLARLALAGVRNARELVPGLDDLRYQPETGMFVDAKGRNQEARVGKLLKGVDARAFGLGRSTLARAVLSNQILQGNLKTDDVGSFKEPVLYSARVQAEVEYQAVADKYRGTEGWLKAPNGKPTLLNERQWIQVRTPQFKKWFGDWEYFAANGGVWNDADGKVSKAVDDNGEPLVVYHGTDKGGFMKFKKPGGEKRGDLGIFTTSNRDMARSYVRKGYPKDIRPLQSREELELAGYQFQAGIQIDGIYRDSLKDAADDYEAEDLARATPAARYIDADGYRSDLFDAESQAVQAAIERVEVGKTPAIYEAFINLRNPNESNFEGAMWSGDRSEQWTVVVDYEVMTLPDGRQYLNEAEARALAKTFADPDDEYEGAEYMVAAEDHWETTDDVVREGRQYDNDGAIIREVVDDGGGPGYDMTPSDVFVALDPNQIKSADFNTGEFGESDDIRYSARATQKLRKDGSLEVKGDADEIRAAIPEGILGRRTKDGLLFAPLDAPRVQAALAGESNAYSRAGAVVARNAMRNGRYIGAPEKFNSPQKLPQLRKILMDLTLEGERGRFWYERSSEEILRMVGGDVDEARKFVALLAIYSPQAKVDTNSTFALRAWSQFKAGQPISVKTKVMDDKAAKAMGDVDEFWSGEKTGNFFNNLLSMIDPATQGKQGATIDMWMMRAGQYSTDAPTKTQYAFMELETNRVASELGWAPQQVQAAIWVAMKARMENSGVKKRTEASSEKRGWIRYDYPLKNGKPQKTRVILDAQKHRDNWLKQAFAHDVTQDDTAQAKFDFADGVRRHLGQISFEARPGRSTGVLPGIHSASYAQQVEFQQAVQRAFLGDNGADRLAQMLGLLVDENNILSPGVWQGEVSPSSQKLVAMAPVKGVDGKNAVDPSQAEALNVYAAVAGLVARQEGVGWHRPFYASTKAAANGVDIDVGRPLQGEEASRLTQAIDKWMLDNNKSGSWNDNFALISSPNGIRLINFGAVTNAELHSGIVAAAESVLPDFDYRVFASDGDMPTNDWKENPDGQGYIQRVGAAGRSDVLDWARAVLAPRVQRVFSEFSERYGWGNPGDLKFSDRVREPGRRDAGRGAAGRPAADGAIQTPEQGVRQTEGKGWQEGRLTPLPGAPNVSGFHGPDPRLVAVAEQYARDNGITLRRQAEYVQVDPERAARIAQAYASMPHAPNDPQVKAAFENLIAQTTAQYRALEAAGYKFWFIDLARDDNQAYASSPWNAMRDVRNNQAMGVFPTEDGFGSGDGGEITGNPLEADTGITWPSGSLDGPRKRVLANDLFRAVHDAFGHGLEGSGFRAQGEENAWQAHVRLFTGSAVAAITTETRGQNSWLNYGPHGEKNRSAAVDETIFADQKTGLMPEWTWTEGIAGDAQYSTRTDQNEQSTQASPRELADIRRGGGDGQAGDGVPPGYGRATPGATSAVGYHFSQQARTSLNSGYYGTGLKGAEAARLAGDENADIRARIFFYVNKGNGVRAESGVGGYGHHVRLDNLYDVFRDELNLVKGVRGQAGNRENNWERAVMAAGFDGYLASDPVMPQGYAVLLGQKHSSVPVAPTQPDQASANPVIAQPVLEVTTRTEGDELVRKPTAAEMTALASPAKRSQIQAAAPSFKLQFGSLRVKQSEAAAADAAIQAFSPTFRFGEVVFSLRDDAALQDKQEVLDAAPLLAEPVAPSKYAGKKVEVPVRIEDTGEVAYLTMDVDRSLDENKHRTANMLELLSCLT